MKKLADFLQKRSLIQDTNTNQPAGYTYLGQFIAHDLTFDNTSIKERQIDPENIHNYRTPALDLDCIYGGGPLTQPYLYEPTNEGFPSRFLLKQVQNKELNSVFFWDLLRLENGIAVIPNPRNDENLFISQLHVAFQLLHNYFEAQNSHLPAEQRFYEAQKLLRWHYQYIILYDYLPRVLDHKIVSQINPIGHYGLHEYSNLKYYDWRNEPYIPLEFSGALFRFGHSQVREFYKIRPDQMIRVFDKIEGQVPTFMVNWMDFFDEKGANLFQFINPILAPSMYSIPTNNNGLTINLAFHNLIRGLTLQLPSGQAVAKAMGLGKDILDRERLYKESLGDLRTNQFPEYREIDEDPDLTEFLDNTPLWLYTLLEAKIHGNGTNLGPMGSRLVAEVIIGIMQSDKTSFLNQDPLWKPEFIKNDPTPTYTMRDFLDMGNILDGARAPGLS